MQVRVLVILLAVLALAAGPAYAQVGGGAKIGVNWSTITEEDEEGVSEDDTVGWKPGLAIGGFVDVPIGPMFSFAPEILYTQKGAKNDFSEGGFDIEQRLKFDFVQIPLLFKAGPTDTDVRPFVVFGPAIGFLTKAEFKETFDGEDFEEDIKDELKSTEFSLIVGGGVQFGRGIVEVRYDHGLSNLTEDDEADDELKTKTFSVLFGVRF